MPKEVRYWLAEPLSSRPFVPNDEVDQIAWIGVDEVKKRLRSADHGLVRGSVPKARPITPLVVIRHALSMRRKEWTGDDADRPLTRDGRAQAARMTGLVAAWAPARVVSSPSRRCRDTVAPLADALGVELELEPCLSEEAYEDDPTPARHLIARLRDGAEAVAVCTHRPLLAMVARTIGLDLPKSARSNPLPKGGLWVAHPDTLYPVDRYRA